MATLHQSYLFILSFICEIYTSLQPQQFCHFPIILINQSQWYSILIFYIKIRGPRRGAPSNSNWFRETRGYDSFVLPIFSMPGIHLPRFTRKSLPIPQLPVSWGTARRCRRRWGRAFRRKAPCVRKKSARRPPG